MNNTKVGASLFKRFFPILLLCMLPLVLNATSLLRNDLLKIEAVELIDTMGLELQKKTGVNAYVIATNEHFPQGFNLVEYSKQYEIKMQKPFVLFIFAPFAIITDKSDVRGRIGIIPSSNAVKAMYDYDEVRDASIDIIAMKDSNSQEDKFNIGVLQSYSELADNIAASKGIKLENTIPNDMGNMITILRALVYFGSVVLLWIFIIRPLWVKRKNGKT